MINHNTFLKPYHLLVCLILFSTPVFSYAQNSTSSGAQFLQVLGGVRGAGMGGMFTAVADDVSTTYWNSAGLGLLRNTELNISEVSYFSSLNYNFAELALPLSEGSVLGLSASYDFVPTFNSTNNPAATPGSENDFAIDLAYGQTFGKNFALGIGGKFFQSTLLTYSATGAAMDAGLLLYTEDRVLTLGLSMQDLGQISTFTGFSAQEQVPLDFRAGLVYRFQPNKPTNFLLGVDGEETVSGDTLIHTGGEAWIGLGGISVAFRGGYTFSQANQDLGGSAGAALGAGIRFQGLELDYALVPEGALGDNNWISLDYRFGSGAPKPTPTPSPIKLAAVEIKPQIADYQRGTLSQATFNLKTQARTDIRNWTVDITDPKGNVIRSYSGKGLPPRQLAWDGKDSNGNVVNGGIYANYNFRTVDTRGQQVSATEAVFKPSQVSSREAILLAKVEPRVFVAPSLPETIQPIKMATSKVLQVPYLSYSDKVTQVNPSYFDYLDQVAALIRKYPNARVYIEGHAYDEGSEKECLLISQQRADAVFSYLVEKGKVSPDNLYSRGHGAAAPLESGNDDDAHIKNRRVDIVILIK
jgi:outer membrane protein OmpA-like peptidoglycan-associated protein